MILAHEVFDEQTLYPRLLDDLRIARGRVIFYVPFATVRRVGILEPHLNACVRRKVKICCFLQEPKNWQANTHSPEMDLLNAAIALLERAGAHVTLRKRMHEKVVIIDDNILYDGSFNVLSQFDTTERMSRHVNPQLVRDAYKRYRLNNCAACFGETPGETFTRTFAVTLKTARRRQGLTQRALAQMCSMHQADISQFESEARKPSVESLVTLLDVLQLRAVFVPQHLLPAIEQITRDK